MKQKIRRLFAFVSILFAGATVPKTSHALILGLVAHPASSALIISGGAAILLGTVGGVTASNRYPPAEGLGVVSFLVWVAGIVLDEDRARLGSTELRSLEDYLRENQYGARNPGKQKKLMAEFLRLDQSVRAHEAGQKLACEVHRIRNCQVQPLQIDLKEIGKADPSDRLNLVQASIKDFYRVDVSGELAQVLLEMHSLTKE